MENPELILERAQLSACAVQLFAQVRLERVQSFEGVSNFFDQGVNTTQLDPGSDQLVCDRLSQVLTHLLREGGELGVRLTMEGLPVEDPQQALKCIALSFDFLGFVV